MVGVDLANLNIMDEEEDPLVVIEDDISADTEYGLCLVGRVFTDSIVNFLSLKNTLADLWHPLRGVSIMEIEDKCILFRYYSEIDLKRVMDVPLGNTIFWVLIHNLPVGFIMEGMVRQFGYFIGKFMKYDASMDLSLRAMSRRGGQLMSKWLREESGNDRWANMEIDGDNMARRFGANVTNQSEHKEGTGSVGRFVHHIRKPMVLRNEDNMGQIEEMRDGAELEYMLVEFVDGKKRQRFNLEVGDPDNIRGLLEVGLENAILAATTKQADWAQ
ncbi:hypothetical protein Golax_020588 [Gossypium laxum]|uniref:DUF4283 domain-containing protein n=1 Tax=Gossypium laxum TaxID=34288 RepID=A0A7J9B3S9_9ROSI|nr:hypothetical protein [Gossypium laxum]